MTNFTAIDLSKLPPPKVIEELSYETIFQDIRDLSIRHDILFVLVNGTSTNFGRNLKAEN